MWTRLRCSVVAWLSPLLLHSFAPLLLGSFPGEIPAFDKVIDSPMYKAPDTPGPRTVFIFPEKAKDLWVRVLERPNAEMRCRAAEAIVRAHDRGVKGLETTIAPLRAALDQPDQHPVSGGQPIACRKREVGVGRDPGQTAADPCGRQHDHLPADLRRVPGDDRHRPVVVHSHGLQPRLAERLLEAHGPQHRHTSALAQAFAQEPCRRLRGGDHVPR